MLQTENGLMVGSSDTLILYDQVKGEIIERENLALTESNRRKGVSQLYVDRFGLMWIGYFNDRWDVYDPESRALLTTNMEADDPSTNSWSVRKITSDLSGDVWIGTTWGGLVQYHHATKTYENYRYQDIPELWVNDILPVGDMLYLATRNNGLLSFDIKSKSFERLPLASGRLSPEIKNLCQLNDSTLLIGSNMGLWQYDLIGKRSKQHPHVLAMDVIKGMIWASEHDLWLSTNNGLVRYKTDSGEITRFTTSDGLVVNYFNDGSVYKNSMGQLYFGSKNGITVIDPDKIHQRKIVGRTYITDFYLDGEHITASESGILKQSILTTDRIHLTHKQNNIGFSFINTNFTSPEKIRYQYQLIGYDTKWNQSPDHSHVTRYTNVPYGNYIFRVEAYLEGNDEMIGFDEMIVDIDTPWYKTAWFLAIAIVFMYGIILLVFRLRTRNLKLIKTELESKVLSKTAQLQNQNDELASITEELKHSNEAKIKFYVNVSHELRTPLTLIISPLEQVIKENNISASMSRRIDLVLNNARRLQNLIVQLLKVRKIELGTDAMELSEIDIVSLIKEVLYSYQDYAELRQIALLCHFDDGDYIISADPEKMETVFHNLISNAFNYMHEKGEIAIEISRKNEDVKIAITDSGEGMHEDQIEHIFDRFQRGESVHKPEMFEGMGIGLSLVKSIVDQHSGSIDVSSKRGEGSTFTITLPVGAMPVGAGLKNRKTEGVKVYSEQPQMHADPPNVKDHATILYVDDNLDMLAHVQQELSGVFTIVTRKNGALGLTYATSHFPDVIVTDVMMPVMDGITFCQKIKENDETSHIPVILLTALSDENAKIEAYNIGADAYVTKPFNIETLKGQIHSINQNRKRLREKYLRLQNTDLGSHLDLKGKERHFLEKAISIVIENMKSADFNNGQFVSQMEMSKTAIYQKLLSLTGQTLSQFIREIRLKEAANMLKQGQYNVTEISYAVGYKDAAQFSREFKKQFGTPPSSYRGDG